MALDDTWFWFILGIFYIIGAVAGLIASWRFTPRSSRFFYHYTMFFLLPIAIIMLVVYSITVARKNLPSLCDENNQHYTAGSPVGYECHRIREFIIAMTCAVGAVVVFFLPVVAILSRYFYYALVWSRNAAPIVVDPKPVVVAMPAAAPFGSANI
jgi:hypothetical protein